MGRRPLCIPRLYRQKSRRRSLPCVFSFVRTRMITMLLATVHEDLTELIAEALLVRPTCQSLRMNLTELIAEAPFSDRHVEAFARD